MNIFILDKNYNQIGILSNEGANPQAPYFDDLYTQELDTGADTFYFTTLSTSASRDFIEIGNHIIFQFNNRHRLFAISDLEFEHKEGRNVIGVYAEGVGFQLLETFMGEFEGGDDTNGDGKVDKEDEGEGEFMTYDMFLEKVLKDTDWNYQIMSGDLTNINMGREVRFSNGKNIYALLQDSMQEFGGVELEFRAEYVGGGLNKTVYAYPHKGRGSFVGQRFEYGHNVAGIKKKQEVVDYMDENIILYEGHETVDGLNTEVTYEVDFALRGYEVEELEIGDTHYVIDNDFEPAQFEARIGKIEISFSDPTKNKCYIANFKKITGSKPDNIDSDNIKDVVDDNLDDKLDDLLDDKLDELDDRFDEINDRLDELEKNNNNPGDVDVEDLTSIEVNTALLTVPLENYSGPAHDQYGGLGIPDKSIYPGISIDKQDLLDFVMNEIEICEHIHSDVIGKYSRVKIPNFSDQYYLGIRPHISYRDNPLFSHTSDNTWSNCVWKSKVGQYIIRKDIKDINGDGDVLDPGEHKTHSYNLPSLVAALVGAFQLHIKNSEDDEDDGSNIDLSDYATKTYVHNALDDMELLPGPQGPPGNKGEKGDVGPAGEDGVSVTNVSINSSNHLITTLSDNRKIDAGALPSGSGGELPSDVFEVIDGKLHIKLPINFEDSANFINCGLTNGKADLTGAVEIDAMTIYCANINPVYDGSGVVQIDGDLKVTGNIISSGSSSSGNGSDFNKYFSYDDTAYYGANSLICNEPLVVTRLIIDGDESNGLRVSGDSMVEISNICAVDSITFSDGSVLTSAGSIATVSEDLLDEQQNTIQQQQETIASLEARIARLEEMLGINN